MITSWSSHRSSPEHSEPRQSLSKSTATSAASSALRSTIRPVTLPCGSKSVKAVEAIRLLDELPKTPTAKVQKHLLRREAVTADTWDREAEGRRVKREVLGA